MRKARFLASSLRSAGYSVWFDETILARKSSWVKEPVDELIFLLEAAVTASRCLVLFAIELQALPSDIEFDVDKAIAAHHVIRTRAGIAAWNWQSFELQCAKQFVAIYDASDAEPTVIIKRLSDLGIYPSGRKTSFLPDALSFVPRQLRTLGRYKRVRELFAGQQPFRPARAFYRGYLSELEFRMTSLLRYEDFLRNPLPFVLIGDIGTGKTTLVNRLQSVGPRPTKFLLVRLPEPDDLEEWGRIARTRSEDSVLIIDDFLDQLVDRSPGEIQTYTRSIQHLSSVDRVRILLVLTTDQADDFISTLGDTQLLLNEMFVRVLRVNPDAASIENIVSHYWRWYEKSANVKWDTTTWDAHSLVSTLNRVPIFSELKPVNYLDLQGTPLAQPTKSLCFMSAVIKNAQTDSYGNVIVTDEVFRNTLKAITGFSTLLMKPENIISAANTVASEIAEHVPFDVNDILRALEYQRAENRTFSFSASTRNY